MFLNYKMSQNLSSFEYPGPKLVKNPPINEDNIRLEIQKTQSILRLTETN